MAEETKQEGYQPDPAATAPPGQEGQQPPEINLGDFAVMIAIIDTVAKRGGFEGPELQDVGILRGRLQTFVDFHKGHDDAGEAPVESIAQSGEDSTETLDFDEAEELVADGPDSVSAE